MATITRRNFFGKLARVSASVATFPALSTFDLAQACSASGVNAPAAPILLSRNENAYGPSETVLAAMQETCSAGNRYPVEECYSLVGKLAALHRIPPEQVVLGCGSSETLRMAAELYLGPGKSLVQASPTFRRLGEFAQTTGAEVISVPLNKMYEHDLETMLARTRASTGLVYICNPNNPTGTLTPRTDIEAFVGKLPPTTMVLIDEAYHHFVSATGAYASFLDRPFNDSRVVVTRTFSKIYGLAGMRIGYVVAAPEVARRLSARRLTFGVSAVSARAAASALDDSAYVLMAARRNANDRQEFMNQANARMMRIIDSHTNFVMLNPGRPVEEVFKHLQSHNIHVAPPIPEMSKYLRVSLGTPVEMLRFWKALDLMPAHKMAM